MSQPELFEPGVLTVRGPDAQSFLQGQLTNDLDLLTETNVLPAAVTNAQGRVIGVARMVAIPDGVLIWLPRSEAGPVRAHLARYILRARVELRDESDGWRALRLDAGGESSSGHLLGTLPGPGAIARHGEMIVIAPDAHAGIAVLGQAEPIARLATALTPDPAIDGGGLAEIRAGWPEIRAETRALFVPQMLNLDLLGAISFRKGCYTGQEVIARTQHLGRIKRRMLRARGALAPPASGTPVLARGEVTGHVVSAALDEHGACEMLATVSVSDRAQPLTVASALLERLSLPYSIPELDGAAPAA